jgi:CRP-like cAMP-binding protein
MDARLPRSFDVAAYLSRLPLFHEMSADELRRIEAGCQVRQLARSEMVFRYGEPCDAFHVCVGGQVKLFVLSASGNEKVIEIVSPGQTFAEALMFTGRRYILNAQALTDCLLLSIGRPSVISEIEHDPRFALRMLAGMARRLHGLVRDVEAYSLQNGVQRVIGYLLRDHAGSHDGGDGSTSSSGFTVSLPVSKATIASRLSLTPEYFSRVLHELEANGLIRVDRRDIHVLDARRLVLHGALDDA